MSFNWGENADDGLTLILTSKLSCIFLPCLCFFSCVFCFFRLLFFSSLACVMPTVFSLSKVFLIKVLLVLFHLILFMRISILQLSSSSYPDIPCVFSP
jgi:hypothetical protein